MEDEEQPVAQGSEPSPEPISPTLDRVNVALRTWYGAHFRSAQLAGRQPLASDDFESLVSLVTAAVSK